MSRGFQRLAPLLLLASLGCEEPEVELRDLEPSRSTPAPEPTAEPAPAPEPEERQPVFVSRRRAIMGTSFEIRVPDRDEAEIGPVMERALDEIERLEAVLSEWQEGSEISRINAAAGGGPVTVGEDTGAIVRAGLTVSRLSGGAFDLSWAALRGLYQFQPGERHVPPIEEVRARLARVDHEAIRFDEEAHSVQLTRADMAIGTGSIAKGYALDRAGAVLRAGGVDNYMLYGGGQVQVRGMRGGRPWRVGIQHPRDPRVYIGFLEASEGSISTSGDYEHAFVDDEGQHWHHIIDLETGLPARASMQVTLLAAEGLYADALSTAAFVLGPERALRMLAEAPGHPEAVIVGPDLRVHMTPGTEERIVWRVEREDGVLPGEPAFEGWR